MITDQIRCDVCGAIKGETNHWLVAIVDPSFVGIAFEPAELLEDRSGPPVFEDICGHACAHKRFSQWLETVTPLTRKGNSHDRQEALA